VRRLIIALFLCAAARAQYDLVLKGGHVIDPKNGIDAQMDVAVTGNKIAAVAPDIAASQAKKIIDAHGLYVTPGLVDIHTHLFFTTGAGGAWAGDESIQPDAFSFRTGVTTHGRCGQRRLARLRNLPPFRDRSRQNARVRVHQHLRSRHAHDAAEQETSEFQPEQVARLAKKHRDVVVGVKSAHYQKPDWASVDRAVEAGKLAGIPVMVDFGWFLPERPYWQLVTQHLRPGDISTHCFRAPVPWVDEHGKLYDYLRQARKRGVIFDVGHGGGSFRLPQRRARRRAGILSRFHLHRPARRQHERRYAGHAHDHVEISRHGRALVEVIRESTINPAPRSSTPS